MSITFKQVRYFLAAVDIGQISLAAMEMNVSQSAVTAAIQALEAQLGVTLLERSTSGVRPTIEGARFLHHARNIAAAVEDAVRIPLGDGRAASGRLRIAATYTVAGYFMARHYTRFRRAYPDVELTMVELSRRDIEAGLVSGDLDVAVMLVSNLANRGEIDHEVLLKSHRRLWLPTDHPLQSAPRVSLEEIASQPYVMLTVDEADQTAGRYWQKAGLAPSVIFSTSSIEAVRSMVAAGVGVSILSDMVYRPWSLEGQRIELRNVDAEVPSMDVGLAWSHRRPLSPPAGVFRAFMSVALGGGG